MKLFTKKIIKLSLLCVLVLNGALHAKVRAVKARRDFEQSIAQESMVIAFFYDDKDKNVTRMYEDISKYQRYDDADVVFLKINCARPELNNLATLYGITTRPMFIFFNHGKRVVDKNGPVKLPGLVSRADLQAGIDLYYGQEIEKYIVKKEAKNKQRLSEENESWKEYFYPRTVNVRSYSPDERSME